ncbi:MAG TPA: prepilin-type N-terminal cleavage/methylation domain-containing protein [Thermotogota bacterium]|nr:prepilin-type N-terminal cleavage/methylation domain-containing protein [Thermotogota bacterium]
MKRSGFTLIELMIVLAIIAALAAILTPMGLNALNRAKATQYVADVRNIKAAQQIYYFDTGSATDLTGLSNGYLNSEELTNTGYSIDTGTASFTVSNYIGNSGIVEQFNISWQDRTSSNSSDTGIELTFDLSN